MILVDKEIKRMERSSITLDIIRFGKSFKKYWYILLICIIAGICVSVVGCIRVPKELERSEVYKTSGNAYFQKVAYVNVNWGDPEPQKQATTAIEEFMLLQEDNAKSEHYRDVLENCRNLFSYGDIRKELDDVLKSKGYNPLGANDNISFSYTSEEYFFITLNCQCSIDRINYLLEQLTNIIMREGQERLGLGECTVAAYSDVYISQKSSTTGFVRSNRRASEWIDEANKSVIVNGTSVDIKGIVVILAAAIVAGLVIIAFICVADKTVVSEIELASIGDSLLLGSIDSEDNTSANELLKVRCENSNKKNLAVLTITDSADSVKEIDDFCKILKESGLMADLYNGCDNIRHSLTKINKNDGAIIAVIKNNTKRDSVITIENILQLAEIPIVGKIFVIDK